MRSTPRVYEKRLILPVSLSELSPSVSLASAICSTHAALSPFQSQYLVVIAADCFQEGDHINTHTLSPPLPLLIVYPSIHGGIPMPLFVSLYPCRLSPALHASTIPFHPLCLSPSIQRQAMNI